MKGVFMFNRCAHGPIISIFVLCLITFGRADYSFRVVVKYPFSSSHFDTLDNWVSDSLVRYREIKLTISNKGFPCLYHLQILFWSDIPS